MSEQVIEKADEEVKDSYKDNNYYIVERIVNGDESAKEELVNSNYKFVAKIANKWYRKIKDSACSRIDVEDLIQVGLIGLINAAYKYEPERKVRFLTCATYYIEKEIRDAVRESNDIVILGIHQYNDINKIMRIMPSINGDGTDCERYKYSKEDIKKAAEKLGVSEKKIEKCLCEAYRIRYSNDTSLNKQTGSEEDSSEVLDFTTYKNAVGCEEDKEPFDFDDKELLCKAVGKMVEFLDAREEKIIRMRFGIGYNRSYTLEEVGKEFGITRERTRQIENIALRKLKNPQCIRAMKKYLLEVGLYEEYIENVRKA